ncbi:GTPase-GDP dissociation stimulator vimar-like [Paramacrobiotus metropolitanus]|uniref:GTPase-GDP dissociation stimulator vimar-like n=1 Tax=Paramacrobiotus metropolitanus TaxID=2943436 RepID=UPI0024462240|nr:GTPase-GDP dissociation stimulator vimar-like [Paramacrobiotus metropolitanus]
MASLDRLLNCLYSTSDFLEQQSILTDITAEISASSKDEFDGKCRFVCSPRFLDTLRTIFKLTSTTFLHSQEGLHKCIILISELAKCESVRHALEPFLVALTDFLERASLSESFRFDVVYDCLRATGNICYENDSGRQIFLDAKGFAKLLSAMNLAVSWAQSEPKEVLKLTKTAVGCLCNVIDSNAACQKAAISSGVFVLLRRLLCDDFYTELHATILAAFVILAEHVETLESLGDPQLISLLLEFLQADNDNLVENSLDLLVKISDSEEGKLAVRQANAISILLEVLERNNLNSELQDQCSSLLVELSVGCALPHNHNENGICFEAEMAAKWLVDNDWNRISKRITAALFIGNLMRDEQSCLAFISHRLSDGNTVAEILKNVFIQSLDLADKILASDDFRTDTGRCNQCIKSSSRLSQKLQEDDNYTDIQPEDCPNCLLISQRKQVLQLQYAVVSALKNLVVNETVRRRVFLDLNFAEVLILAVVKLGQFTCGPIRSPVVSKFLALLRMFISLDQDTAVLFGTSDVVVKQMFSWVTEPTVTNYSLLAVVTTVKTSNYSCNVMNCFLRHGMVKLLSDQLIEKAAAVVMSGLGAIALFFQQQDAVRMFLEDADHQEFLSALNTCLQDGRLSTDGVLLGLQIVEYLSRAQKFASVILRSGIPGTVARLKSHPVEDIRKKAAQIDTFL